MGRNTIIAIACAVIAGVLIIIAGRSLAGDPKKPDSRTPTSGTTQKRQEYQLVYNTEANKRELLGYDLFGNPIYAEQPSDEVEYDELGNPVTTAPTEPETDENGEIVTTVPTEPETDESGETVTQTTADTEDTTTTTGDAAEGEPATTVKPGFSGFDHGDTGGDSSNVKPTLPPDYKITIR